MSAPRIPDPFAGMAISQAQAAGARKQLELLAEQSSDRAVKEVARDVLAGRTDLRAAMLGHKLEEALNEAMASFSSWHRNLSDEQRAEQEHRAAEYLEEVRQEAAAQQLRRQRPRSRPEDDDEWEEPTILRKDPPRR